MSFQSLGFLLFFPCCCLVNYLLPQRARNGWLLAQATFSISAAACRLQRCWRR